MDFIERIFGVSPDGGSGTAEVGIAMAVAAAIAWLAWRRAARSRR